MYNYKVLLRDEEEGGFTAIVPTLPGCISYGETLQESLEMIKEAIELYLEELKSRGEVIQDDSKTFEYTLSVA